MKLLRPSLQAIAFFFLTFFAQAIKAECPTNMVLHTQSEIDSFSIIYPDCPGIWGDLTISGMDITSLDSLYGIKSIVGNLYIDSTSIVDLDGLDNVNYFGGSTVHVKSNPNLISLEGLPSGSDCTNVIIKNNPSLINVEGITFISHQGSMLIEHNGITSLEGLSVLSGSLKVKNNNHLKSFGGISAIDGILEVVDNDSLTCLCGLEELTILTRLSIEHNASLQSLQGLDSLQWMHANLENKRQ